MNFLRTVVIAMLVVAFVNSCNHREESIPARAWSAPTPLDADIFRGEVTGLPPEIVYINGEAWQLLPEKVVPQIPADVHPPDDPRNYETVAETFCTLHQILFKVSLGYVSIRNSLWHELMHAGACRNRIDMPRYWNSQDIHYVGDGYYRLGDYLSMLFRDNPELAAWLARPEPLCSHVQTGLPCLSTAEPGISVSTSTIVLSGRPEPHRPGRK